MEFTDLNLLKVEGVEARPLSDCSTCNVYLCYNSQMTDSPCIIKLEISSFLLTITFPEDNQFLLNILLLFVLRSCQLYIVPPPKKKKTTTNKQQHVFVYKSYEYDIILNFET